MNYYIRYPSEENMHILNERCAEFKSILIVETIKQLDISETDKKKTYEHVLEYLKEHRL